MDFTSLIIILAVIVVFYLFIKFVVNPVIKAIIGIAALLILIYLLQRFFGFSLDQILAPFGISFNLNNWGFNLDWIMNPINSLINQSESFTKPFLNNLPKSINK